MKLNHIKLENTQSSVYYFSKENIDSCGEPFIIVISKNLPMSVINSSPATCEEQSCITSKMITSSKNDIKITYIKLKKYIKKGREKNSLPETEKCSELVETPLCKSLKNKPNQLILNIPNSELYVNNNNDCQPILTNLVGSKIRSSKKKATNSEIQVMHTQIDIKSSKQELNNLGTSSDELFDDGTEKGNFNYKCKICFFKCGSGREYNHHLRDEHPILFMCPQCPYKTRRKFHYTRHIRSVHFQQRPFKCKECDMRFKENDALKQHRITHLKKISSNSENNSEALVKCEICLKVYRSTSALNEHSLTHCDDQTVLCEVCGASFKTRAVYRNHFKVVHGDQNSKAACDICGKTFVTKFSLQRHARQHDEKHEKSLGDLSVIDVSEEAETPSVTVPKSKAPLAQYSEALVEETENVASIYTDGASNENFNQSIDNQIPYVIHSVVDIVND